MITASIFISMLLLFWILNKKSKNDFFFQSETIIRNKLKFILDIWEDFGFDIYDETKLRIAFEYFIANPKAFNGTSIINDFWLIKGLEPESVIHDYDYIMATSFKDLHKANIEYCSRLRKRNSQFLWVWGFIFCGLTIVSIFKSIKYLKTKTK
jgi:hypothetical protein